MQFMILRRADAATEAGAPPGIAAFAALLAEAGVLRAAEELQPGAQGIRAVIEAGAACVQAAPFAPPGELVAGFVVLEVASREEALAWVARWPAQAGQPPAELEIRVTGCPGGCAEVAHAATTDAGQRYALLLRSDAALEADTVPAQHLLDRLNDFNAHQVAAGILLAGDGLRGSASAMRIRTGGARHSVIDGPFTEVKELIAGYWLIRRESMQAALEWAQSVPYPSGDSVVIELREVRPMPVAIGEAGHHAAAGASFTPALQQAEQAMRASQLEAGLHRELASTPLTWR